MSNTSNAMASLIRTSALSWKEDFINQHVNIDEAYINDEALEEWNWSSGERVLLGVLKVIARGHGYVRFDDIFKLDRENQASVLLAMKIRCGLVDEFGADV